MNRWFYDTRNINSLGDWVDLHDAYGPKGERPERLVGVVAWVDDDTQDNGAFRVFLHEGGAGNPVAVLPLATTSGAGPVVPCSYPLDVDSQPRLWCDVDGAVPTTARFRGFYMILEGRC